MLYIGSFEYYSEDGKNRSRQGSIICLTEIKDAEATGDQSERRPQKERIKSDLFQEQTDIRSG